MYSSIFILVICVCASNAVENRFFHLDKLFEGGMRCLIGVDESRCRYNELKVSYNLFTNENEEFRQLNSSDLSQCPDPKNLVKIIIHGWFSNPNHEWIKNMTEAYLQQGNYNVIAVDWTEAAHKITYFSSAVNTLCVGNMIGEFILNYLEPCGIPVENIHIIGHSLGAHLAGFVGKKVASEIQPRKISRISGLDMAGICFVGHSPENRLYKGDAHIVDVYHTDELVGCDETVGDYDFYINGGEAPQPGCEKITFKVSEIINGALHCSHGRVTEYFTESITSDKFIATKCVKNGRHFTVTGPNTIMGEMLPITTLHGEYCIRTNAEPPYALQD